MKLHNSFLTLSTLFLTLTPILPNVIFPNEGPFIGIVSIPSDINGYPSDSYSYFPASYVKFIESGGAQVIPIPYDLPRDRITSLLDNLNGVFFTGGDAAYFNEDGSFTLIADTLQFIVNYVVNKNSQGVFYPLWGTCQGYEVIGSTLAGSFDVRTHCVGCEAVNKNNYVNDKYKSRLLSHMAHDLINKMSYGHLSYFAEYYKFGTDLFESGGPLSQVLMPVTFAYDQEGSKYVSSFESPTMPIYGTQFHQEKSTFEWHSLSPYNHSLDAVRLQQYLSDFFVNEARKNKNTFFSDFSDYVIENFASVLVHDSGYSSLYMFPAQGTDNSDNYDTSDDNTSGNSNSTSSDPTTLNSTTSDLTALNSIQSAGMFKVFGVIVTVSMIVSCL